MADNIENVKIPAGVWVDLYDETGIPVGEPIAVENLGASEVQLAVGATQPLRTHQSFNILSRNGEALRNTAGDSGAWAYSNNENGLVSVRSVTNASGFYPELASIEGGAGGGFEVVGVKDAANARISPATSAKQLPDGHGVTVANQIDQPLQDGGNVAVSNFPASQPVSADSLPLPDGAATEANQLPNGHDVAVTNTDFPDATTNTSVRAVESALTSVTGDCEGTPVINVKQCGGSSATEENASQFFVNDEHGIALNKDGLGASVLSHYQWIHGGGADLGPNGVLEMPWTTSQGAGTGVDFNENPSIFATQPRSGTFHIDFRGASDESEWTFIAPADIPNTTSVLEFGLYIQRWEAQASRQMEVWLTKTGTQTGATIQLRDYIDRTGGIGQYQLVRIPLADINPSVDWDGLNFKLKHQRIDGYLDDIRLLNETGDPTAALVYTLAPPENQKLIVESLVHSVIATSPPTTTGRVNFDYNDFFTLAKLPIGLLYQRNQNGIAQVSFGISRNWDLLRVGETRLETEQGDTTAMFKIISVFARPLVLSHASGDSLSFTVRDDLSGIAEYNISVKAARVDE